MDKGSSLTYGVDPYMAIFNRNSGSGSEGAKDPRDMVGQNPTGRERKSSAGKRRQAARRLDRDLEGTEYEKKDDA